MNDPVKAPPHLRGLNKFELVRRMAGNAQEAFRWLHATHGPTVSVGLMGGQYVSTIDLPSVQRVLRDHQKNYSKGSQYTEFEPLWGKENLLASHGDVWARHRRVVASEFLPAQQADYQALTVQHTRALLDAYAHAPRSGEPLRLYDGVRPLIMRILCDKWFGELPEPDVRRMSLLLGELTDIIGARVFVPIRLPLRLPTPTHVRFRGLLSELHALLTRTVREHGAEARVRMNLLGRMLAARDAEARVSLSEAELLDNLVVLLLAAYETPSLGWALYFIGREPAVAERVHAEVREVLGERAPTLEDLPRLRYVRMCIDESMRLFSVSPLLVRQALTDDELGACRIRAGTHVVIPSCAIHHTPGLWPEPRVFRPERFEDPERVHPFSFMPFGKGARECIGRALALQFSTTIVAMLFQRYAYTLSEGYEARPNNKFTPFPLGRVPVHLTPRAA